MKSQKEEREKFVVFYSTELPLFKNYLDHEMAQAFYKNDPHQIAIIAAKRYQIELAMEKAIEIESAALNLEIEIYLKEHNKS